MTSNTQKAISISKSTPNHPIFTSVIYPSSMSRGVWLTPKIYLHYKNRVLEEQARFLTIALRRSYRETYRQQMAFNQLDNNLDALEIEVNDKIRGIRTEF